MRYKEDFVMSKYVTMEELLRAKVKYLESECDNALDRLHQCKRRNREDKVKLRNIIGKCKKEYYELIVQLSAKSKESEAVL